MNIYNRPIRAYAIRNSTGEFWGFRGTWGSSALIYSDRATAEWALDKARETEIFCEVVTFDLVEVPDNKQV